MATIDAQGNFVGTGSIVPGGTPASTQTVTAPPTPSTTTTNTTGTTTTSPSPISGYDPSYAQYGISSQDWATLGDPNSTQIQYDTILGKLNQGLQQNNQLVQQKNAVVQAMLGGTVDPTTLAKLPPDIQNIIQSGDRNNLLLQAQILNGQISGYDTSVQQAVQTIANDYPKMQQNYLDSLKLLNDISASTGQDIPTLMKMYFPGMLKNMTPEQQAALGGGVTTPTNGASVDNVTNAMNAIGQYESHGDYSAIGQTTEEGNNAYGKYQIMDFNIPTWTQEALGKSMTPQQFLADPAAQDATAKYMIGKYWDQYGNINDVASMWFTGGPSSPGVSKADITGTTSPQYIRAVSDMFNKLSTNAAPTQQGMYADILQNKNPEQAAYFNSLAPNEQSLVAQILRGDALLSDVAKGYGGASTAKRLLAEAQRVEPGFSENIQKRRYQFQTAWFSPSAAAFKTRTSINTSLGHIAQAYNDFKAIDNGTLRKYNSLANMFSKETGDPAVSNFNYDITQLAAEIASAYKNGTAPTDQETEQERNALIAGMSPAQGQGVFDRASKLLSSKITSMANEYQSAMGKYPDDPIVQESQLQELIDSGVNVKPILDVLQKQGYDMSKYNTSGNANTGSSVMTGGTESDPMGLGI